MTNKGGELLKHLDSLKEKYNMEKKDIDEIINLIYEMVIEMIEGKNGRKKN